MGEEGTYRRSRGSDQEYRWRLKAANGQVIATSGQGYKAKADCQHGIDLVRKEAAKARVEEVAEGAEEL